MTEQELQSVINAVLSSIKTNSRSIGQLTGVQTLSDSDCFEVAGGRKIAYSVLRDLIFAAANTKLENMQTDIANSVLQSASFDVTGNTATLTIKQKGYDAITVSVPIATDSQSGIMTAADKVKLDSTYSKQEIKQEIDAEADAIRDEMTSHLNSITSTVNGNSDAIKKKQDKLVAGDDATRLNGAKLSTKQIFTGSIDTITRVAPVALAVGEYCFNTATKKLYVGAQHDNAVVTDTVPMPDDFLFIDTKSGTTYRCDGTTLQNIANIKTINGQSLLGKGNVWLTGADFLLEQDAGLTINEAVNSNTDALQNKLDKASVVQTPGTATDKVMSQKSVTDDINSAISFARRQGVPQAKCFQFSEDYTFYSGSQLKDKTLIVGLYGMQTFLSGSIYYNNTYHELQIGNGERKRLTDNNRITTSEHAETLVVYFDDDGIAHAYMDGKLCYDFPSNTQPDTVTINVLEGKKFKQILLLDGDLHQAANDLLWAKGWQDWLVNNRNMNTTREVKKIDNSTGLWMATGTTTYKLYVVDYNITNNTEKDAQVSVNRNTIGYGGEIEVPAGQSVSVRRVVDTSGQGALGYNDKNLPFSLTAKSVAVIKGIDYRYVYNGGFYDLAGLVPTDEPTIIPNPEEYLKIKSNNTYPNAVGQIGYDTTGKLYMGAIDLTWKQINNT